jgi:hypothetical protein
MKRILLILSAFYLVLIACNSTEKSNIAETPSTPVKDTIKIAEWDTMAFRYSQKWHPDSSYYHAFSTNNIDTIEYIEIEGEPRRISYKTASDTSIMWVIFYQINNDLKLVRFREKKELPQRTAKEAFSYLENGKMFYSNVKSKVLQPGEIMAMFRLAETIDFARPDTEMMAEYTPYWEITKKGIEDYKKGKYPKLKLGN